MVEPVCTLNVQAEGAVPVTVQYTIRERYCAFSKRAWFAWFAKAGVIKVPGVAGPIPEPAEKLVEAVKTAGLVKEQLAVALELKAHTVALMV